MKSLASFSVESRLAHFKLCRELRHDIESLELLAKMDAYIILLEETMRNLNTNRDKHD